MLGLLILIFIFLALFYSYLQSVNLFAKIAFVAAISIQFLLARAGFIYTNLSFVFLFITFLILVVLNFKKIIRLKYFWLIIICQITFLVYILLTSLVRGDFIEMFNFTKFYFFGFLLFFLINSARKNLDINRIYRFIIVFTLLLSVLGLFQFLVPSTFDFFVVDLSGLGYKSSEINLNKRVVGLSLSPTHFGNLLALLLTFTVGVRNRVNISTYIINIGIIIGIAAIILSGIKTPLVTFIIGVGIFAFFSKDKFLLKLLPVGVIILFFSWGILAGIGDAYDPNEGFSNSFGRSLQLFALFNSGGINDESTFSLTLQALKDFSEAPLIGSGDKMLWLQSFSITDAYLVYHLVQFGLIGMLILFFPYLRIIKDFKDRHSFGLSLALFIVLLTQTFTDTGVFYYPINMTFCILLSILLKQSYLSSAVPNIDVRPT